MTFPLDFVIPAAANNPSNDQPIMQMNNVSIYGLMDVDHVTYGMMNAGTHKHVTFEGTSLSTPLPTLYSEIYPQAFGTGTVYIENYIENQPSAGLPITGYLPFVKAIGSYVLPNSYPNPAVPVANSLSANVSSVILGASVILTVTFITPLPYNTYMILLDANSVTGTITKTNAGFSFVVAGSYAGRTFQFMVI
jgi:hypothetical protein